MKLLSASGVKRAIKCQYWLREDVPHHKDEGSKAAKFGTAVHECCELYGKGEHLNLLLVAEKYQLDEDETEDLYNRFQLFLRWFDPYRKGRMIGLFYEVAFAYNPFEHTTRILKMAGPRDYSSVNKECEIAMTADIIQFEGDLPEVIDIKTGVYTVYPDSDQNKTLALALSAYTKKTEIVSGILTIRPDKSDYSSIVLTTEELNEHRESLKALPKLVPEARPNLGGHCTFCPASTNCPAMKDTVHGMAMDTIKPAASLVRNQHKFEAVVRSQDHAAWLVDAIGFVEDTRKRVRAALEDFVQANGPVDMGDGISWGPTSQTTEHVDTENEAVYKVIQEAGAGAAIKTKTSVTWKDLGTLMPEKKVREIRLKLREIKGTKFKNQTKWERRKRSESKG